MNQPERLSSHDPKAIQRALEVLNAEGLIVFPTDTLYGLACLPNSKRALDKIYATKHRSRAKALPVLIADTTQLTEITHEIPPNAQKLIKHFWPGKLTLILPKKEGKFQHLSTLDGIALRMPNHPFALELLGKSGPLAVTSANLSEHANHADPAEILAELAGHLDLFIDDGILTSTTASTIVDCTQTPPLILRDGAISKAELHTVLGDEIARFDS